LGRGICGKAQWIYRRPEAQVCLGHVPDLPGPCSSPTKLVGGEFGCCCLPARLRYNELEFGAET